MALIAAYLCDSVDELSSDFSSYWAKMFSMMIALRKSKMALIKNKKNKLHLQRSNDVLRRVWRLGGGGRRKGDYIPIATLSPSE